ncbi:Putative conjugal transfer protein [Roseimaritima multifibrata]|uniref:Conjugal transfer protein n=1 Tax=Roseimaritima multifibrata TaxID=1930274 RepID=A0A517M8U3_9BACT|nr:CpaF family protein [Roseimaritima multifibrata]QDS91300.1 Putative conjugal transfer protein [Roseimaritima multifibrata]
MIRSLEKVPQDARAKRLSELKVQLHKKLISGMDMRVLNNVSTEVMVTQLRAAAEHLCGGHTDLLTQAERTRLIDELVDETLGFGPLEPLLNDPTISDILINGPNSVFVERRGKVEPSTACFRSLDHLIEIVQRIVGRVGRRIDESSPIVDARLPDGSRLNAVVKPLAIDGALVSIRRAATRPLTASDLIAHGAISKEMLTFLGAAVRGGANILVSGGTGAGKTTLLNALSAFISPDERIVTIEDAAELQLQQPHVAKMETRPPNLEGKGEINCRDLLKNALRMRPDRIIVGECRGAEAFDMLQSMNTGHDGGMTTLHANDCREALSRLSMLTNLAAPELPMQLIERQIASSIDLVVQVARLPSGARKVIQISEITGMMSNAINIHDIFTWNQEGVDKEGKPIGHFSACGIVPDCLEKLMNQGWQPPKDLFTASPNSDARIDRIWGDKTI